MSPPRLHPVLIRAARGELPKWAAVSPGRRRHLHSVAALMSRWAAEECLSGRDRQRWAAAAWLHDALRDADPAELAEDANEFPPALRHGPAAAARLEYAGVADPALLRAIRYHTLGHPEFERLGRFLYLADYLDPLRHFQPVWRASLRARLPGELDVVLRVVCRGRVASLLKRGLPLRPETVEFWNGLVG